jgi:hypothetical protein
MHQMKVGLGTIILLVACVGSYLPFSIPHPFKDATYTIHDNLAENDAKMLGSKYVLKKS